MENQPEEVQDDRNAQVASQVEGARELNFGAHRMLSREQAEEIRDLSERFARGLSSSLGAWLKADVLVGLSNVRRTSFQESLEGISERETYFASVQFDAVTAASLLQLDLQLGYCALDLLLGGTGRPAVNTELTHVDEQLFGALVSFICEELTTTWRTIGLSSRFADRLIHTQVNRLMLPDEQALCLTFEMHVAEAKGNLVLVLPAAVSSFLLRQLSGAGKGHREHPPAIRDRLSRIAGRIQYPLVLQLPSTKISYSSLASIREGDVVMLDIKDSTLPCLEIAGRKLFTSRAVRHGNYRAAMLVEAVPSH